MEGIIPAWGRILQGYRPNLSIEITRECPLRCPGCYAYGDDHLGGEVTLRQMSDLKGDALVNGVLWVLRTGAPWHDLPGRYPPYQTCHRRFQARQRAGVLRRLLTRSAEDLRDRGTPDLSEAYIDASFSSAISRPA